MKCTLIGKTGDLRLVDGVHRGDGGVEVCADSSWSSVCVDDQYWTEMNARVACRQLGYPNGE